MGKRNKLFLFAGFLLLSLAGYAWLAAYAHPVADDYCYAAKSAGLSYWDWSVSEWIHWNGRFASNLLMIHSPMTWWPDPLIGYRLVPGLLLALTFLGAWILLRRLARHALSTGVELLAALVFLLLYLNLMPDLGEGFYWYTAAITYQLGSILLLFHLALLVPGHGKGIAAAAAWALNLLLALAITGMDEVHMLLMLGFHTVRLIWLVTQRKAVVAAALLLLVTLGGAALMYMAPGNAVRGAMFADTHLFLHSLGMSALQAVRFIGNWLLSPALLAMALVYVPLHRPLADRVPGFKELLRMPWWIAAMLPFLLVMATTFPAYWSTGLLGQHRTVNVACLFCLPLLFVNLAMALERGPLRRLAGAVPPPLVHLTTMVLAALALDLSGNGYLTNADLLGGRAAAYDRVMTDRERQMRAAAADPSARVVFIHQADPPRTLTSYEGRYRLGEWMVHCQARYFGVDEAQLVLDRP